MRAVAFLGFASASSGDSRYLLVLHFSVAFKLLFVFNSKQEL